MAGRKRKRKYFRFRFFLANGQIRNRISLFLFFSFFFFSLIFFISNENGILTHNPISVDQCVWNKRIRTTYTHSPSPTSAAPRFTQINAVSLASCQCCKFLVFLRARYRFIDGCTSANGWAIAFDALDPGREWTFFPPVVGG